MNIRPVSCLSVLLLSACQLQATAIEQPALLLNPGNVALKELSATAATLTGFSPVLFSEQDFTVDSEVLVERRHQFNRQGDLIQGRDLEIPHRLRLLKRGDQCWLLDVKTGQQGLLNEVRCRVK